MTNTIREKSVPEVWQEIVSEYGFLQSRAFLYPFKAPGVRHRGETGIILSLCLDLK